MDYPAEGQWFGIRFRPGTFMPQLPMAKLLNGNDVTLPGASPRSFWLNGSAWEYPNYENSETFVARLVKAAVIVRDPAVEAALRGEPRALSKRSLQRHFLQATGITHKTYRQIERARYAVNLLRQGVSILDTVHEAGYFDQAHLSRSLKNLIGQTPAKIIREDKQLSLSYKTARLDEAIVRTSLTSAKRFSIDSTVVLKARGGREPIRKEHTCARSSTRHTSHSTALSRTHRTGRERRRRRYRRHHPDRAAFRV